MPIYVYKCPECGTVEELLQPLEPTPKPPKCDVCGLVMDKQPAAGNFSIRGYNAANGYASK